MHVGDVKIQMKSHENTASSSSTNPQSQQQQSRNQQQNKHGQNQNREHQREREERGAYQQHTSQHVMGMEGSQTGLQSTAPSFQQGMRDGWNKKEIIF
jgi:hypothetical protein